jgi:hypothetical protein
VRRIAVVLMAGLAVTLTGGAKAADLPYHHYSHHYSHHHHYAARHRTYADCGWRHPCHSTCPDRFSCAPMYGAYGPFGGVQYWRAYDAAGW